MIVIICISLNMSKNKHIFIFFKTLRFWVIIKYKISLQLFIKLCFSHLFVISVFKKLHFPASLSSGLLGEIQILSDLCTCTQWREDRHQRSYFLYFCCFCFLVLPTVVMWPLEFSAAALAMVPATSHVFQTQETKSPFG